MSALPPAVEWVRRVAEHLGDLVADVVFLGGATVGLLITETGAPVVRPTKDVDLIVEIGSWAEYTVLQQELRERGFREDTDEDAPICRWMVDGIKVDVMPTDGEVLGFANRWYELGLRLAKPFPLTTMTTIRLITAPLFIATKLEAFFDRGDGDFQLSHDLEDIVAIVDGRPELRDEIKRSEAEVRDYLRARVRHLLADQYFRDSLPGHLAGDVGSQSRLPILVQRLEAIVEDIE
jgi:hypothetical protein